LGVEDENLKKWAGHYSGVAIFGVLSLLLAAGKVANFQIRKFYPFNRVVIPPAIVAGLIGCFLFHTLTEIISPSIKIALEESMGVVVINLLTLCFAGLALGFGASKSYVPETRAIFLGLWHEALPMLLYAQILIWGQSCVALMVGKLFLRDGYVSSYLGALVCLGMETGRDTSAYSGALAAGAPNAHDIVRQADAVGLIVSMTASIAFMTWNAYLKSSQGHKTRGLKKGNYNLDSSQQHHEHFNRDKIKFKDASSGPMERKGVIIEMRQRNQSPQHIQSRSSLGIDIDDDIKESNFSNSPENDYKNRVADRNWNKKGESLLGNDMSINGPHSNQDNKAGLGAHISLMATAILIAWLIDLMVRLGEERVEWLKKHHVISGFRLFKLSMCTALALICIIRRTSSLIFKSEWFFPDEWPLLGLNGGSRTWNINSSIAARREHFSIYNDRTCLCTVECPCLWCPCPAVVPKPLGYQRGCHIIR